MRNIFFGKIKKRKTVKKKVSFTVKTKQKYNFKFQICYYLVNKRQVFEWESGRLDDNPEALI